MRRPLVFLALLAGCGPSPLPAPCHGGPIESAQPRLAIGAGGATYAYGPEGLPEGRFVRRFDGGALTWTVSLPPIDSYARDEFVVAGDSVFIFDGQTFAAVTIVRDAAVAARGTSPFDCGVATLEPHADYVRVFGVANATDRLCSFRVERDGTFDALVGFDAELGFGGRTLPDGGFVVHSKEGLVGYDANGVRHWLHAGIFTSDITIAPDAIYAFRYDERVQTLVRIGLDGGGEDPLLAFDTDPSDSGNNHVTVYAQATSDGIVAAVEHDYRYSHELLRASSAGIVWSRALDELAGEALGGVALGSGLVVVRGKALAAFDLDGNPAWRGAAPLDAVVAADDRVTVADVRSLDACRSVLRVRTVDAAGTEQSTWSAR